MSDFETWSKAESVDDLLSMPNGLPTGRWDSSRGIQAQTAAIVVATRQLEETVRKIDAASRGMARASIMLAIAAVVLAGAQVAIPLWRAM
ncbi:hypothetical protein [Phycicoccus sp.]|uniref:hypothetical protein n=1 Tax=Phycicoccus sp. TaxID=1902410 RepID=UPI002D0F1B67|nr:hypothetical protein [Phycicoccus sp.]HMM96710.1 hypothetical protein [Phycicoccus sp.]